VNEQEKRRKAAPGAPSGSVRETTGDETRAAPPGGPDSGARGEGPAQADQSPIEGGAKPRRRRAPRKRTAPTVAPESGEGSATEAEVANEPPTVVAPQLEAPAEGPTTPDDADSDTDDLLDTRATEPGAWAAAHARRLRSRRRGGRRQRKAPVAGDEAADAAASTADEEPRDTVADRLPEVEANRGVRVAEPAPDEALLERSAVPVSDEAVAAATSDEPVAPARRRRRGRRGRGTSTSRAVPEPQGEPGAEPAAVVPAEAKREGASVVEPQADSQDAAAVLLGPGEQDETVDAAEAPDAEEEGAETPKRRHRGRRGGRRHRRKDGETAEEASASDGAPPAGMLDAALDGEAAVTAVEAPTIESAVSGAAEEVAEQVADGQAEPAKRPRRRGRRGRGGGTSENGAQPAPPRQPDDARAAAAAPHAKKKRAAAEPAGTAVAVAPAAIAVAPAAAAEATDKVGRRRGGRLRRAPSTVAPDLPGYKEILVTEDAGELRVALVEDGRLAEIYIERPGKRSYAGNIYKGKVDNVLPGMDAAFVDIGLERNGFLYVDDVADPGGGEKRAKKITQMLKPGQEVMVQVSKDPMGSKGARLTGQLSLAGRYLVYVPGGSGVGVSRRLPPDERDRLRELCKSLTAKNAGLIVRTVAEGKNVDELKNDLRFLSRLWSRLKAKADKVKAPGLVYQEADVSLQVSRDLYNESFSQVLVDDPKRLKELVGYLEKVAPELATRVKPYEGEQALFRAHGIEEQIARALERRVPLPSGGNLVIDHTEALTVIDVNTGRFTGGKGLEDTITRNNLEAAREVVRQLRLRDIGGIIIIDFIDMEYARNREAVLAKLQAELETDRTKTYVVEISPLGLVEMTRQNITDGARGILTQTCPACEGKARILSPETMAITIERRLGDHAKVTSAGALLVEVNASVADRLVAGGRVKRLEKTTGKRFFLEGSRLLPIETFRIVAEGSLDAVESHRIPVREDQEVTLELEYALTYSPGDAVAHVNGYQVIVLNGRRALGEKRKVRVTSMTRAGATAVLVS
jgi:ribonuclease G